MTGLLASVGLAAAAFAAGLWLRRDVNDRLARIHDQVTALRAAHDFEFSSLCRRMSDVEKAAAVAAIEARIMSGQLDRRLPEPAREGGGDGGA